MRKSIYRIIKKYIIYFANCNNNRNNSIWVFTEWYGNRCGDNATYLANYVAENYPEIEIYWIYKEDTDTSRVHQRIIRCVKGSKKAVSVLKKAGVVVMIQGIGEFDEDGFNYCGNALKVNLWHGQIWKKLGYDIGNGLHFPESLIVKMQHSFKRRYLFESPSDEYKRLLSHAMSIDPSEFINAGQPRNMLFFDKKLITHMRKQIEENLNQICSVEINKATKIIAYMPTFRDHTDEIFNFEDMGKEQGFMNYLEEKNIVIVQKAHFVNTRRKTTKESVKIERIVTINDLIAQELLLATDLLITDYSSCFFDYLILNRPIIHFLYDYDYYANNDRGLYYSWEDIVGGSVAFDKKQLFEVIKENIENPNIKLQLRNQRMLKFLKYESADSCKIITQEIMGKLLPKDKRS